MVYIVLFYVNIYLMYVVQDIKFKHDTLSGKNNSGNKQFKILAIQSFL